MAKTRQELSKEIELSLGGGMIDVELDPEHYNLAIDKALAKYRQRSARATEESFIAITLTLEQQEYVLPTEVIEVKDIYRRQTGSFGSGVGADIEPFEAAYLNTYMLHSGRAGGLATFEAYHEMREHLGRMFGSEYLFTWKPWNNTLFIHRKVKSDDDVFVHCYNYKPDATLIADTYSASWIREWSISESKMMLAEARGKFVTIAGPQGGTALNAETLRQDATQSFQALEEELKTYVDGGDPLGFVIG